MNNKHKDTLLVVLTFTLAAILCAVVSVVIVYGEHKRNDNNENNIAACEQVLKICFSKQDICLDRLNTCIDLVDAYRDYVDINAEDVLKEKQ